MTDTDTGTDPKQPEKRPAETPESGPPESGSPESGTGAGQSDAPRIMIGAQESTAINANLAGLAAGTVRLAP
jgi:hypothetical protein